ncbi:UPF0472 protein C16orf72-like protein [Sciurus carolinensis]|uniref:UPF0472 protein C16orf72-like protein n=1 Tax=Sciurus carolinensis TaxID=30640 RepID=A0AA41SUG0_SCICA|nr:UPF0472 protein C16orf72-like protein [Sciurus carolinensis]
MSPLTSGGTQGCTNDDDDQEQHDRVQSCSARLTPYQLTRRAGLRVRGKGGSDGVYLSWDRVCQQPGLSLWVPFQNAATTVTNLYKESVDTHQRSFDIGIQIGYQRCNKDVLAWVKKRRTIRREDLISFLCGKFPPPRNSRAPPRLTVVSPNRATSTETSSSVETDLQPFREAIALHGLRVQWLV